MGDRRTRSAPTLVWAGLGIVGLMAAVAVLAPLVAPSAPDAFVAAPLQPPGHGHVLGTDDVGHDLLTELLYGTRTSLLVGVAAAVLGVTLSTTVALAAGYRAGMVDMTLMRLADLFLVLPRLPLLLLLITLTGPGILTIAVVIAVLSWPWGARILRGQVLSLRTRAHIRAAELFGAGGVYIARRHLLPELGPIVAAEFVANVRFAVLAEAGLAFLGLADPGTKSWGSTLHYALVHPGIYFGDTWTWWVLPPAFALTLLLAGVTFAGIGLETRWNPRLETGQ